MLNRITKRSKKLNTIQTALYNWIETKDIFKRSEISEQANLIGVKDRTLSDILKRFIELKLIEKVSHGVYTKR
jgi:DNA-binding MarR family transcriptional regulator